MPVLRSVMQADINPYYPVNLLGFRIYRETLSRFSCAASLEQFNKSYTQQLKLAKRLLSINKLVPIYISKDVILFPIKHQRAPIQIYFNAQRIIGLTSSQNKTIITFDNSAQCVVDEPYILVYKKWQESILLAYLINKTTSFH
ncbi:competence protein ComK [Staphylococcus hominis]